MVFATNNFGDIEILEYVEYKKVLIKFIKTGNTKYASMGNIRKGAVCDNELPNLYDVGFTDIPKRDNPRLHSLWCGMFVRCYNKSNTNNTRHSYANQVWLYTNKFLCIFRY